MINDDRRLLAAFSTRKRLFPTGASLILEEVASLRCQASGSSSSWNVIDPGCKLESPPRYDLVWASTHKPPVVVVAVVSKLPSRAGQSFERIALPGGRLMI